MVLMTAALVAALGTSSLAAQTSAGKSPQTDQTVAVTRGARLGIENEAGEVTVRTWERDAVRVQARHSARTRVSIRTVATGVAIAASGTQGPSGSVDYEISVPVWMPLQIEGTYAFITVEGTQSEVSAATVRGDITIRAPASLVSAESIEGEVIVDGAKGRVKATSVNNSVTITGASGDLVIETTNGAIVLTKIASANADVGSVNGSITYEGTPAPRGRYRFSTHNSNLWVAVPETSSASFTVRTYNGTTSTNLPMQGGGDGRRGKRVTYVLGGGGAEYELESFNGTVHLRRPGTLPAKAKSRDR
jgi:DUF4097 and DUF4098 domain-containing protein YvlB